MKRIDIVALPDVTEPPRRLVSLYRVEPLDGETAHHHGFGPTSAGWNWGTSPSWFDWWEREHYGEWGYIFYFDDETRGVSRVDEVNQALAAVGYMVDRRGDARD